MKKSPGKRSPITIADQRLLSAARLAQHEGGSFADLFQSVSAIGGTVELLAQLVGNSTEPPDDVNWASIAYLLEDCARRLGPMHAALFELERFEREV